MATSPEFPAALTAKAMSGPDSVPGEEYEYDAHRMLVYLWHYADLDDSYEGLPPDYTLGHNMLAGAFAGIAVRFFCPDYGMNGWTDCCTRNTP